MKNENIGTTKRRKQMLLNNKNKDDSIYYYGNESKYISAQANGKFLLIFLVSISFLEEEENKNTAKRSKSQGKSRGRPPKGPNVTRALFKDREDSVASSKFFIKIGYT